VQKPFKPFFMVNCAGPGHEYSVLQPGGPMVAS